MHCFAIETATLVCASTVLAPRWGVDDDLVEGEEGRVEGGLLLEHIECRTGNLP